MATPDPVRRNRRYRWAGGVVGMIALVTFFPLFRLVPLKATREHSANAAFDAAAFIESFWEGQLLESLEDAVDAGELFAALQVNPTEAAKRFGHRLGMSGRSSYFVSGTGQIVKVDTDAVTIALKDDGSQLVVIETGPVFGNAVRDGSGLLDVSDFSNSQDFNALSTEINRRVEEQILPLLTGEAEVGATVRFAGGVEMTDSGPVPAALVLVPVRVEFP